MLSLTPPVHPAEVPAFSPRPTPAAATPACPSSGPEVRLAEPADDFGRLVQLYRSNERLEAELTANRAGLAEARAYLARPDANRTLGRARLEQLRTRRSGLLAMLRANRIEALALLARHESPRPGADRPARSA